jgi:hypothetical protein
LEYWRVTDLALGVVITCRGHDRMHTVHAAVDAFDRAVAKREGRFAILADLREMTGYETESRQAWQHVFARHRRRVDALVLVGAKSKLIRMGAAAVGAFSGIPVRFVDSWADVPGGEHLA